MSNRYADLKLNFVHLNCLISDNELAIPVVPVGEPQWDSATKPMDTTGVEGLFENTRMLYVDQDYYEANPWLFNTAPDGITGGGHVEMC